jgi:hypothetical protein
LYGLSDDAWERRHLDWLSNVGRSGEMRTYGVWLAHRTADGFTGVRVGTFDWREYELGGPPDAGPVDPLHESARRGVHGLVDLTLPDPTVLSGQGNRSVLDAVTVHASQRIREVADWPTTTWEIDGAVATARIWSFSGAWTGIVLVSSTRSVVAIGVGVSPGDLRLVGLADTAAYGFNAHEPIDRVMTDAGDREWPETALRRPNRSMWHPDQTTLLG